MSLVHPSSQQLELPPSERAQVRGLPVPWPRFPGPYHYVLEYYLYSQRAARTIANGDPPQAVYGQGYTLWAYLRGARSPTVFNPHGLEQFQRQLPRDRLILLPWRAIARYHVRRATKAVSLGGKLTDYLVRECGAAPDRVVIIPNGVSLEHVDALLPPKGAVRRSIVFAGRLVGHKGLDVLTRSLRRIADGDFELEIIGDGPLSGSLHALGDPRLSFHGWLDDASLFRRLGTAWGLVFPGRGEGMPTVLLEAMAASLPVVATDIGAVRDLVTPDTGFLVPPGDADALAEAIQALLGLTEEERLRMGRAARSRVEERFTWERVAEETLGVLEACVQAGSLRAT